MNRRRFLVAAGTGVAALGVGRVADARAATDDDLAVANYGVAASWLLQDVHARIVARRLGTLPQLVASRRAAAAAGQHATALSALLSGAGQTAPTREDFTFALPTAAFVKRGAAETLVRSVTKAVGGAYQSAAATATESSYRVLFASLVASLAGQLALVTGSTEPFPVALDLETASTAIEEYLG